MSTTLGAIMTNVGTVFTSSIGWVSSVASTITSTPILLLFCVLPIVGLAVGLFKRLINVN